MEDAMKESSCWIPSQDTIPHEELACSFFSDNEIVVTAHVFFFAY